MAVSKQGSGQFKPIARGPKLGAPLSLENIAIDRLRVDPDYQRATTGDKSRRLIIGMVKEWDWSLCLPLLVSRRADGSLWIVDGQHRHAAARERGDIHYLPCAIQPLHDPAVEARVFVGVNSKRQTLSQADLFNGQLAMGDPDAKGVAALLNLTGWRVVRSSATDHFKPGDLNCAPMLVKELRANGAAPVRAALTILRQAYPDDVITAPATLIRALIVLLRDTPKARGRFAGRDLKTIVTAMAAFPAGRWLTRAEVMRHRNPALTRITAMVEAIADQVDNGDQAPPPAGQVRAHLLDPPPRKVELPPAGNTAPDGKRWCDQCEQRVTSTQAEACTSQFCAAKAKAA